MMSEKSPRNPAFEKWLRRASNNDIKICAGILKFLACSHPADTVWEYLEATGDKHYTNETFEKAAQIALRNAEEELK